MRKILTSLFILVLTNFSCSQPEKFEYTVEMPAAFELANILVALTDFGENDDNIVRKNTPSILIKKHLKN